MHPKIQEALIAANVQYQEIRHDSFQTPIRSPFDFAAALGYDIARITKTVFLRSKTRDKYLMVICSADKKFDLPKIAQLAGVNKLEVAEKQELANMIGYPPTGVCAIAIPANISVFADEALLSLPTILTGSGEVGIEIELTPADLVKLSRAVVDQITQSA